MQSPLIARKSRIIQRTRSDQPIEDYTIGLALFDYLPVIVAGIGLHLVCRYAAQALAFENVWTLIIPAIAVTGGGLKATWKLIVVTRDTSIQWMSDQLFFFIAAAYLLLAALVILGLRARAAGKPLPPRWWQVPVALAVLVVVAALYLNMTSPGRTWSFLLLGVMSLSNLVFSLRLIGHAFARRNWPAVAGFVLNLCLSWVLVGLARIPEQTASLQWIEEILNLAAVSFLAAAAWSLIHRATEGDIRDGYT